MELFMGLKPPQPLELSGNISENWKEFKEDLTIYMEALGIEDKPSKQKTNMLLNLVGRPGRELYKGFVYEDANGNQNYDTVLAKFEEHCVPRTSNYLEREKLYRMRQRSDQTVDQFLSEIRNQIRKSGLDGDAQKDNMIRDKLRSGILDENVKRNW